MNTLPIELIPGSHPSRFKWSRIVDTPTGRRTIQCEGCLTASVEDAVALLIGIAHKQEKEIATLRSQNDELRKTQANPSTKQTPPAAPIVKTPEKASKKGA